MSGCWLMRATFDSAACINLYQQMDRMVVEEGIIVPLTYARLHMLIKPGAKSFQLPLSRFGIGRML
jgi:hypothetical protein